jgi:hypothetical protein
MLVTVLDGVAVAVTGKPDDSGGASSPRCRDISLCLPPPAGLLLLSSVLPSPRLSLRPASLSLSFFFLFPFFFLPCSPLFFFFLFLSLSPSLVLLALAALMVAEWWCWMVVVEGHGGERGAAAGNPKRMIFF